MILFQIATAALIVIPFIVLILWGQQAWISRWFGMKRPYFMGRLAGILGALPAFIRYLIFAGIISLESDLISISCWTGMKCCTKFPPASFVCFVLLASASSSLLLVHPVHLVNLIFSASVRQNFSLFKKWIAGARAVRQRISTRHCRAPLFCLHCLCISCSWLL